MRWLDRFFPKTGNVLKEGPRLIILNTIYLVVSGVITYGLFLLVSMIRRFGVPLPFPVWLVLLFIGVPYFITWFEFGKSFGSHIVKSRFMKGLYVGLIGHIPVFLLKLIMIKFQKYMKMPVEISPIMNNMLNMILIVLPIMVALGALDDYD